MSRDKQDEMKTSEMAVKLSSCKADKYILYNLNGVNPNQNQYSSRKSKTPIQRHNVPKNKKSEKDLEVNLEE